MIFLRAQILDHLKPQLLPRLLGQTLAFPLVLKSDSVGLTDPHLMGDPTLEIRLRQDNAVEEEHHLQALVVDIAMNAAMSAARTITAADVRRHGVHLAESLKCRQADRMTVTIAAITMVGEVRMYDPTE